MVLLHIYLFINVETEEFCILIFICIQISALMKEFFKRSILLLLNDPGKKSVYEVVYWNLC